MVNLFRRRRFLAITVILIFLLDRVVFVIFVGRCSWRRGGCVVMAGLATAVPLTLVGTAANVVVDR